MFTKTIHPLDLLLAVLAAATSGAAIFYWLALMGLAALLVAASIMALAIGGLIAFSLWFFSARR